MIIKVACYACGEVRISPRDVMLLVSDEQPEWSSYGFTCPRCRARVVVAATARVISLLLSADVRATVWNPPAEAFELHDGPPLTDDDLIDFGLALTRCDPSELIR